MIPDCLASFNDGLNLGIQRFRKPSELIGNLVIDEGYGKYKTRLGTTLGRCMINTRARIRDFWQGKPCISLKENLIIIIILRIGNLILSMIN